MGRGPGALLTHSCGDGTCLLWSKEGPGAQRSRLVLTSPPCLTSSPRNQKAHGLPQAPSWLMARPLPLPRCPQPHCRRRGCGGTSVPVPHPHTEPIVPGTQGADSAHCHPFTGTGHPRGGLCQGHPPSPVGQLGGGAAHSSPTQGARACGRPSQPQVQDQTLTPCKPLEQAPTYREKSLLWHCAR